MTALHIDDLDAKAPIDPMDAPFDDEPVTPEDVAAIAEARAQIARGEGMSTDALLRSLGLWSWIAYAALVHRIVRAVERYAESGDGDVKKLQGVERAWRLRVGDWRVLFTLDQRVRLMSVDRVAPRGGAYK